MTTKQEQLLDRINDLQTRRCASVKELEERLEDLTRAYEELEETGFYNDEGADQ